MRITCADGNLELAVEDRGTGISTPATAADPARGMGMVSMRERAELIGGELDVRRSAGGGTIVHLRVPGCLATDERPEVAS